MVEEPDAFLDEFQQDAGADLHLIRGDNGFVYFRRQQFVAGLSGEQALVFLEKAAFAGDGFDDSQALQLGVSLGNGVAIDAQFLGQRADGGERVARAQGPGGGGITDLINQLEVNRFAGLKIDVKHHC